MLQEALDLTASIAARRANVSRGVITIMRPENVQGVIRGVVRAIDGTTDGAADYAIGDFFEIPADQFSTTVLVRARGDDLTERNESFQAEILVTEPLGVAGPASNPEVVLLDTDRPITLEVAEATVSAAEGEFLEIKVQAKQGSDPAPPRSAPGGVHPDPELPGLRRDRRRRFAGHRRRNHARRGKRRRTHRDGRSGGRTRPRRACPFRSPTTPTPPMR